jgi:hypothetical protein
LASLKDKFKIGTKSFSRKTKMNFFDISLFIMNMLNKTLQTEVNDFIKNFKNNEISYSKTAFSKARMKISPELFRELNRFFIKDIYEDKNEIKLFRGLRIFGIDGTTLELPNMRIPKDIQQSENIQKIYGHMSNHTEKVKYVSRTSAIYDLENNIIVDGILGSYSSSEHFMAIEHLNALIEHNKSLKVKYKDLVIYDRGYPSIGLIGFHNKQNIDFLMRINTQSFKAVQKFQRSEKLDEILDIEVSHSILNNLSNEIQHQEIKKLNLNVGDKITVRAIKVILKNGTVETLITSLLSKEEYKTEIFKELYFKRWGIEVSYDRLKNKFQVENFTGLTQIAINQDFFATLLTNNIFFLVFNNLMEEKISLYNQRKKRKYLYQLNQNFSIGVLKDRVIEMLMQNAKTNKILKIIEKKIIVNLLPIKPNRSFKRGTSTTKFPTSKKAGF